MPTEGSSERSKRQRKLPKKYEIEEESTEEQNKRLRKEQRSTKSGNDLHSRGRALVGGQTEVLFTATWPAKGRWAKVQITAFDSVRDTFTIWMVDDKLEKRDFIFRARACRETIDNAFSPKKSGTSRVQQTVVIKPEAAAIEEVPFDIASVNTADLDDIKSKNFVEKLSHMLESPPGKFDSIIEWSVCGRLLILVDVSKFHCFSSQRIPRSIR
jgi:hypothetical protein